MADCQVSTYQRLLHEAMQIANRILADIGGGEDNIDNVDYAVVAAKFAAILKENEAIVDAHCEDGKRPTAWRQAKSDIYCALKAGHALLKTPGIGQSALRKSKEKLVEAANTAEDAAVNAEHNKAHGVAEVPKNPEKKLEGDGSVGGEDKSTKAKGANVSIIVPDRKFKDPKLAAAATAFITAMMDLEATSGKNKREKTGADVAMSTVKAATDTLDTSLESFKNAMAALAQVS
ncbi:MAG: hypothetical protein V3S69_03840 [Dehalococcoidales bacterium]